MMDVTMSADRESDSGTDPPIGNDMAQEVMIASLTVESAEGCDHLYHEILPIYIGKDLFVGRDGEQCLLSFNSVFISRLHFRIYSIDLDEDDQAPPPLIYCEDRMSANGTYVNDTLIGTHKSPKCPYLLSDGDIITIRPHWRFRFNQSLPAPNSSFTAAQTQEMKIFDELYKVSDRILGSGRYGTVYATSDMTTHHQLACKIVTLEESNKALMDPGKVQEQMKSAEEMRKKVFKEVEILTKISHPNILSVYKVYHSDQNLYIFSELAPGGDLLAFIAANGYFLDDLSACVVCHQLAMAVQFLHSNGIAHRDLKPENILVMQNLSGSRVVLSDFGSATYFNKGNKASRMMSFVGTEDYLAPEFHRLAQGYTEAADLWSLGVVAVCALSGARIFPFKELQSLHQTDVASKLSMNDQRSSYQNAWQAISDSARDFVESLLVLDATKRMTAKQAVEHDWFRIPKGRDAELKKLHERTSMTWNKRPTNVNLIESIPEITFKSKTRALKKLPDATASPYFNLEKHLHARSISSYEVRKNRQRILRNVRESGSPFVTSMSNGFEGTNSVPKSNSQKKSSVTRKNSDLPLRPQPSKAPHREHSGAIKEGQASRRKAINLKSLEGGMISTSYLAPQESSEIMSIPEVNPSDLFGATPVEIRAAKDAEDAMNQFSQLERLGLNSIGDDYDSREELRRELFSLLSPEHESQHLDLPATIYLRRHRGKGGPSDHSGPKKRKLMTPFLDRMHDPVRLSSAADDFSQEVKHTKRPTQGTNIYAPTEEEEELAAMDYDGAEPRSRVNDDDHQQSLENDYSADQEMYDEAWRSLQGQAVTAKMLKDMIEVKKEEAKRRCQEKINSEGDQMSLESVHDC